MSKRGQDGVTLIELLIAITITTIIMGPIAGAIFVGLHTSGGTQNRVLESVSANLLSSYFTPDVQNAVVVATNASETAGVCPAPQTVPLLITTVAGTSSISYYRGTGLRQNYLLRRVCNGGAAAPPTVISRSLVPLPAGASAIAFSCAPSCPAFTSVTATISQQNPLDSGPYVATVTAARRVT